MSERVMLSGMVPRLLPLLGADTPNHRKLYSLVLDGTVRMNKDAAGHYYANEDDIPAIAGAIQSAFSRYRRARAAAA